jgi:ubiquinone biosynthesis protein
MKRRSFRRSIRHLGRYREILQILVKYGFWNIVEKIQVGLLHDVTKKIFPRHEKREYAILGTPVRLRMAIEELGPTFIKLGQLLSVRPDLIPSSIAEEFTKLQDEVEALPFEKIRPALEREYQKPFEDLFLKMEEKAIAAASLAQVHQAILEDGTKVAVKILRPNIKKIIETDLEILFNLAELAEKYIPEMELYDPVGIVKEFARTIRREQNMRLEARYIEIFRKHFHGDRMVKIPKVYWDYTNEKVLVTEFIDGIKISDLRKIEEAGLDRKQIAENGAKLLLKQVFETGLFHADPHPGNIFVLTENVIAPVDFGMVGRIDDETREALVSILRSVVQKDVYRLARVLVNIGMVEKETDFKQLQRDLSDYLDRYYGIPLSEVDLNQLVNELITLVSEHHIKLPADLVMMGKALVISESVGRQLYPDFNLFELLAPYTKKIFFNRFNPAYQYRYFTRIVDETYELLRNMPGDIRNILTKIKQDNLSIYFQHRGLENLTRELDRASNRIAFALIIAAIIIASSVIIIFDKGPFIWGYPALGIVGYVLASVLGLWLSIAILRSGKL